MRYEWIEEAMQNGGVLTTSEVKGSFAATMNWRKTEPICGEPRSTFPDAISSLNDALWEEATEREETQQTK